MSENKVKIHGAKRKWESPIFCAKKHYCPSCDSLLIKTKSEKLVNSKSEETKNYDFSFDETNLIGNVKFIETVFHCEKCNKTYSIKEVKYIEQT